MKRNSKKWNEWNEHIIYEYSISDVEIIQENVAYMKKTRKPLYHYHLEDELIIACEELAKRYFL
jgi:hypothetical protein